MRRRKIRVFVRSSTPRTENMQPIPGKKTYAVVGVGGRSKFFTHAIVKDFADAAQLVALCDSNPIALKNAGEELRGLGAELTLWREDEFDRMIESHHPDVVLVTSKDSTHDHYICRAMELGCDVLTEKPMTIDAERCRRIIETRKRTGRNCRVAFNYRYMPRSTQIKEMLMDGIIGPVTSVVLTYNLGLIHGPFYFNRWHGEMAESGGLLVHKSTHHFDLVNFWLGDNPSTVYARGKRNYFTREMARQMGLERIGTRCPTCPERRRCPFFNDIRIKTRPTNGEPVNGDFDPHYYQDLCVFREEVDTYDTMHVMVDYESGAMLNYNLITFGDSEYLNVTFHGTQGRLESNGELPFKVYPHKGPMYEVKAKKSAGGHGGGDPALLRDLFAMEPPPDRCQRAANESAGAMSILIGIAANASIAQNRQVAIDELVSNIDPPQHAKMPRLDEPFDPKAIRLWIDRRRHEAEERRRKARETEADSFTAPAALN